MQHGFHMMHWLDSVRDTVIVFEHPPFVTPAGNVTWIEDRLDFAYRAANRAVVIAKGSGHVTMADRPDMVWQAVVAAVEQVRQTAQR